MDSIGADQKVLDWRVETIDEASSTNDLLSARARKGEAEGLVIQATSQTKGRGRRGRSWFSPPGSGLYFSALFRPHGETGISPVMTLLLGVAVAEGLREATGPSYRAQMAERFEGGRKKNRRNPLRIHEPTEPASLRCRRRGGEPHDEGNRFSSRTAWVGLLGSSFGRAGS